MQVLDEISMARYIRERIEYVMNPTHLQYGFTTLEIMEGHLLELYALTKTLHLRELHAEISGHISEVRDRRMEKVRRQLQYIEENESQDER